MGARRRVRTGWLPPRRKREFEGLIHLRARAHADFDFSSRNRRPPRDPVNALLSFAYALLVKDLRIALLGVGFDPMVGVFHRPRAGRPALALDLMEEFRPLIADSVVLSAINTQVVTPDDFVRAAGAVALTDKGRKAFLAAYERRLGQEIGHPLFGYVLSYRRILAVQARLLARVMQGELSAYPQRRGQRQLQVAEAARVMQGELSAYPSFRTR